jgi:hypothetical protein
METTSVETHSQFDCHDHLSYTNCRHVNRQRDIVMLIIISAALVLHDSCTDDSENFIQPC